MINQDVLIIENARLLVQETSVTFAMILNAKAVPTSLVTLVIHVAEQLTQMTPTQEMSELAKARLDGQMLTMSTVTHVTIFVIHVRAMTAVLMCGVPISTVLLVFHRPLTLLLMLQATRTVKAAVQL
jgi:hypothetical protein